MLYTYETLYSEYMEQYIAIPFAPWLVWVLTPVVVIFLYPLIVFILLFLSGLLSRVYHHRLRYVFNRDEWEGARYALAAIWDPLGWLWNGYEVVGLENIPGYNEGGALIVFYHGAIPIDTYYILSKAMLHKRRCIRLIADRFLFKVPGLNLLLEKVLQAFTGSFKDCVKNLKEGHLVALAPGGILEAQFGDEEYKLVWGKRIGFAKVAIEAQVPIIPMFTQNVREVSRSMKIGKSWLRKIYEKTKLPVVPMYGGFPVKLRTYLGKPIPYDPNVTAEELAAKTVKVIEDMIRLHQRVPGSIVKGIIDRVYETSKLKNE